VVSVSWAVVASEADAKIYQPVVALVSPYYLPLQLLFHLEQRLVQLTGILVVVASAFRVLLPLRAATPGAHRLHHLHPEEAEEAASVLLEERPSPSPWLLLLTWLSPLLWLWQLEVRL